MTCILEFMNQNGDVTARKTITVRNLDEAIYGGTQWITGKAPATGEPWHGGMLPASFAVREVDAHGIAGNVPYASQGV